MGSWDAEKHEVVIVGGGMTGLMAARTLQDMGFDSVVLEKSKGLGGRCATRRVNEAVFDHGAQYFTVRDRDFQFLVDVWMAWGVVREWTRSFPTVGGVTELAGHPRYCGVDGMTGMAKALARGLDVRREKKVKRITEGPGRWLVEMEDGSRLQTNYLVLTPPVPQSLRLINDENTWRLGAVLSPLLSIHYSPCIAAMAILGGPSGIPEPGAMRVDEGDIAWIADNQRKGISRNAVAVTIHATSAFSELHLNTDPQEAARLLAEEAAPLLASPVTDLRGHRWRYSLPSSTLPTSFFFVDGRAPLFFAGDAFGGTRMEGAVLSGIAVARKIARLLEHNGDK